MIERIYNLETGEVTERPFTAEEIAAVEDARKEAAIIADIQEEAALKKAAVLAALAAQTGFTAEEIKQALNA